ncbi:hypothetical protein HGRIS_008657 [Hohenbuehelia grisea]|uniref:F-box domain-containing protein n=1 Tax=Hohenbuehelia grisea TaxID=104357 RepID=A0ABR3J933_9AGAR
MPRTTILDLPEDVGLSLSKIIARENPFDSLKAMALVSHAMRRAVAPELYKSLKFRGLDYEVEDSWPSGSDVLNGAARHVSWYILSPSPVQLSTLPAFMSCFNAITELEYMADSFHPTLTLLMIMRVLNVLTCKSPRLHRLRIWFNVRSTSDSEEEVPSIPDTPKFDIPKIETLSLDWSDDSPEFVEASRVHLACIITSSLDTLREVELAFPYGRYEAKPIIQLLVNASGLEVFKIMTSSPDGDVHAAIAEAAPGIRQLEVDLTTGDMPVTAFVFASDPLCQVLGKFQNLRQLRLSLNVDQATGDFPQGNDVAWYLRCLERRRAATQHLARICPHLEECSWIAWPVDAVLYRIAYRFRIVRQSAGGLGGDLKGTGAIGRRGEPLVQTYREWFMEAEYSDRWEGDFPPNLIVHPDDAHRWPEFAKDVVARPVLTDEGGYDPRSRSD